MNKKSTERKDYKNDINVRTQGYYTDPETPVTPIVNSPEETQTNLGPLPTSGNRINDPMVTRVRVYFSYDGGWNNTPSPQRDMMSSTYGCGFSYDGGYDGTTSANNDTMSATFGLTLKYL